MLTTRAIRNRLSRYTGSVMENAALAAELRISGAQHMFLRYDERAQPEDDVTHNGIYPTGISGAPLLDLGDFTSAAAYSSETTDQSSVSSILIEYHPKYTAMVALKIGPIAAGIRNWLHSRPAAGHAPGE